MCLLQDDYCKSSVRLRSGYSEVQSLQAPQEDQVALHLVCDYLKEGNLIDATKATYLISPEIQSPMGAHLAAFASREDAQKIQGEKGGELYDWQGIQAKFQGHQHPASSDHHNMHDH